MAQTLSNFDAVLKNIYLGPVREQMNMATVLLRELDRDEENVAGKNATIAAHYGSNQGVGARPDAGSLPTAGQQSYKDMIVPVKYNYGRIKVTGPTIKAARNNAGAFLKAVESELKGVLKDLKKDVNRQLLNDGLAGLTACGTTTGSTTVNVTTTKYIKAGMRIDIRNSTTGAAIANGDSVTVVTVPSATTFTVADVVTTSSAHSVYREDSAGASAGALVSYEMNGLKNIVSLTATTQGLAPSAWDWWKAASVDSATTTQDLPAMQAVADAVEANGGDVNLLLTSYQARRWYYGLLVPDVRFAPEKLKGGQTKLTWNDMPIEVDPDFADNRWYFLDKSSLKIYRQADWDWMDEDGAILHRVSGEDAYEAVLYHYGELGCDNRGVNGVQTALTA